jgi:DnaJ domain
MQGFEAHFQVLELDRTASLGEMKQAYRDLVMVWHPDRFGQNVRLRQKAEDKLKQFNEAYECLKQWYTHPGQSKKPSSGSATPSTPPTYTSSRSSQDAQRRAHVSSPPPQVNTSDLYITFAHAQYILQRYCFKPLSTSNTAHQDYQSGPFMLVVCPEPLALSLSVPCNSLQEFDRILLSIPCKSTGHFDQAEAEQLLQLLQVHSKK